MTVNPPQHAYTVGGGGTKVNSYVFSPNNPTTANVNYPVKQLWINTVTSAVWQLLSFTSANGIVLANWAAIGNTVNATRDPLSTDNTFPVGTTWSNTNGPDNYNFWALVAYSSPGVAVWMSLTEEAAGTVASITGDDMTQILPDVDDNIDIGGGSGGFIQTKVDPENPSGMIIYTSGALAVESGGTGQDTLTEYGVLIGKGTSGIQAVSPSSTVGAAFIGAGAAAPPAYSTTFKIIDSASNTTTAQLDTSQSSLVTLNVINTNTSAGAAGIEIQTGVGSTGDVYVKTGINDGQFYAAGVGGSVSGNPWILASGTTPSGGTTLLQVSSAGAATTPLQPAFSVFANADIPNVTGNGTPYTILFNTKLYDTTTSYSTSTGLFTAPVTGKYLFVTSVSIGGATIANPQINIVLQGSAQSFIIDGENIGAVQSSGGYTSNGSCIVSMTAGDTMSVNVNVQGTNLVLLGGNSTGTDTFFSGYLLG